ncbi:MAG: CotH kinase family protein [Eubacteriales bacterium]
MKKWLSLLLAGVLLILAFSSCDSSEEKNGEESTSAQSGTSVGSDSTTDTASPETEIPTVTADGSYLTANYSTVDGKTVQKYPRLTNLPTLYITLDNGKKISAIPHGIYIGAQYTFVSDYVEDSYYELPMSIKGRGNYSWSFLQKPYSLKLDEKADFLGMGAAKKWVLVTVSSDRTMMRNYMTQKFAKELGLPGTCDNEYVDVVLNGSYLGTYVLTEKIEIGEHRIDVPEDQGILFEIEMVYRHTCENCVVLYENKKSPDNSVHLELKYYKDEDTDSWTRSERDLRLKKLQSYFDQIAKAMQRDDYETLQKVLDIDSFVNWYLLNEITRNYDSAFVTSCYCFIDENNILHMGPCWDYDTCYGSQFAESQGQHIQDAPWFGWLFAYCPEFVKAVEVRWTELRDNGAIDKFLSDIDVTRETIALSERMEHTLYPISEVRNYNSYDEAIQYLKDWLDARLKWMDQQFYRPQK